MTRSLLFAGSALVLSLGYARAAPGTPSAPASSDAAAVLQVRGDHAGARAEAKRVLAARPSDAEALLVGACAAIEQRHLDAAESFAGRLAARAPPDPRAPVLVGLVARRRAHPSEPMLTSLANAWREAGRPDLSAVPQAGGPALWDRAFPALDGGSLGSLRPGQQLVLAQRELDDDRRPLAIAVARAPDGQPLVVLLHALYAIRGPNGSPPPDPVLVGALARAVVAAEPDNGMLALAGWLARTPRDAPLAEGDAAALTSFARMPRFEYPARRLARELVELARPVDPWAESLPARRPDVHLPYTVIHLAYRVVPTTERARAQGEANPAIAAALAAISKRLETAPTHLERLLAAILGENASAIAGDATPSPEVQRRMEAARHATTAAEDAIQRIGLRSWPLAALWREWTPDELTRLELLAQ